LELSTLLEKIAFSPIDEVVFSGNKARVLLKKFPPANLLSYPSQEVPHISFGPTFSVKIDSEREGTFSTFRKYFSGKASFLTSVCFTRPWYHFRRFENTFRKRLLFSPPYVLPARGTH
jgi:hypothetical protein